MDARAHRLFNLSAFAMTITGILAGTGVLLLTQGRLLEAARSLRTQGMFLALLLLGLGLLFKVHAALSARADKETPGTRNLRYAGFGLVAVALANLAVTLRGTPGGGLVQAVAARDPDLARRMSLHISDATAQGLFLTVALLLLALYAFLTALLPGPPPPPTKEERETTKIRKAAKIED